MEYISNQGTIDIHISDYLPVFVIKKKEKVKSKYNYFTTRGYKDYNGYTRISEFITCE